MDRDATKMRQGRPFVFTSLRSREGVAKVIDLIGQIGGIETPADRAA